jgi:lipid II:glycine glycyltransferase (peptidoglycan interpeptide bridge formation enzyme)
MIRRAEKSSLDYKWVKDSHNFYKLYSKNMHVLGSPTHSQKFYDTILEYFPDNSRIMEVYHENVCIYGAFYLFHRTNMINSWSSTLPEYRSLNPTDYGIWKAILWGIKNGYSTYDFGRSQINSGNLEFKRRWNATQKPLFYYYYSNNKYLNVTHKNPNRSKFEKYWVKMPNTLVNTLGPRIRKFLP